ncbi:hypothetical protein E3J79_02555 [Candidatus Dependentiae bacterium]|nr:MAG: hypothetical protein E3J79_02555 [Candidatus Dependentiae bacterium]
MSTKNLKSTIKKTRRPTVVADIYHHMYTGKQMPISDAFFERLAIDLTNWAKNDKQAINLHQFTLKMGIPWNSFCRWSQTKEPLKRVYDDVKLMLATRREVGMLYGKMKERPIMYTMHRYDPDWDEADKRWSDLKKKEREEEQSKVVNVYIPDLTVEEKPFDPNDYKLSHGYQVKK